MEMAFQMAHNFVNNPDTNLSSQNNSLKIFCSNLSNTRSAVSISITRVLDVRILYLSFFYSKMFRIPNLAGSLCLGHLTLIQCKYRFQQTGAYIEAFLMLMARSLSLSF